MCGQHNVKATARDNTEYNRGHTASYRIEIKIVDPAGNRTQAAGLESSTTDHVTATD